jgi:hypothetical protein
MGLARRKGGVLLFEERKEAYLRSSVQREKKRRRHAFSAKSARLKKIGQPERGS